MFDFEIQRPHRRGHHPAREEHHGGPHGRHGHHHGGGPHERPFGPRRDRMERGALRTILLDTLRETPRHGYDIIKAIEERSHGQYVPSPGTVYPTLQYLEDLGFVRSAQENDRRVFELTDSGRAEIESQKERIEAFWAGFVSNAPSEAAQHEIGFLQDELRDLSRTAWGGLRGAMASGDQETIRNVRLAVQRCQDEIRTLIAGVSSNKAG